uniref:Protein tyrosine phosphatase n=1 Tax=Panagrolaimus sp. ES5 TaxID=591445 RepID=A0AC34GEU5_9BILA
TYESILLRAIVGTEQFALHLHKWFDWPAIVGTEQFALHLHKWFDWPDFGVPPSGMGLLRLLRVVRIDPGATALIHCSAGVGRTGTVMAIELALRAILEGKEVNILEIVKEIRCHRACA